MQPVATRRLEAEQTAEIAYAVSRTRALGRPDLAGATPKQARSARWRRSSDYTQDLNEHAERR